MNIFFDVDYTLMAMDGTLRPHTKDIFKQLLIDRHKIFIWSGVGDRTSDVNRHGLSEYVSGVFVKPIADFEIGLKRFKVLPRPDFVIDDHREIVEYFGGVHIEPFYFKSSDDEHMNLLYAAIYSFESSGDSDHKGFKKKMERG